LVFMRIGEKKKRASAAEFERRLPQDVNRREGTAGNIRATGSKVLEGMKKTAGKKKDKELRGDWTFDLKGKYPHEKKRG